MNKHIPWEFVIAYLKGEISEDNLILFMHWKSNKNNDILLDEIRQLWISVQQRVITYTPDEKRNWEILNKRLFLDNKTGYSTPKKRIQFVFSKYFAASFVMLMLLGGAFLWDKLTNTKPKPIVFSTYNGKSKLILPDSTEVWLHAHSCIEYMSDYNRNKRDVKLVGEAYFKVSKSEKHPFLVITDELKIEVFGTEFNVESYPESEHILVSLIKGGISVTSKFQSLKLVPKDEVVFNKQTKEISVIPNSDISQTSIWINEKLLFENQPLDQIVSTLSRWYGVDISIDPHFSKQYTYTFTLRDEPLDEILRIMSRINPMKYEFDQNNKLHISEE